MQIKNEILKYRQIIVIIFISVALFVLIAFIFFSALQSSSIFEKLLHDVFEIDLLTLGKINTNNGSMSMDRRYALGLIEIMDDGLYKYKMILSEPGSSVVSSLYSSIKNKFIQSADYIVFTESEYSLLRRNIRQIQIFITDSSEEQKRSLNILFILLLFVVAILIVLFIVASIRIDKEKRLHQYDRELAKKISESENRIHNLLSSELHDDIGQMLVFLKLKLIETNSSLSKDIDPIIDSVRNLSHNLKIPEFSSGHFTGRVEELISQFSTASSIRIEYTLCDFHNELYPDYYPILIFRVIQECLQNALKHSKAENIRINMVESAPFLIIRYKDDGIGVDNVSTPVVLKSIEDRAKLLGAELRVDAGVDVGLQIAMKIPFLKELD